MNDKDSAQNVIEAYRKKQQDAQKAPLIIGIAALLLIVGAGALIYWLIGPSKPGFSLFASQTPTPTNTATATLTPTETATATVTPTSKPTLTAMPTATQNGPYSYQVVEGDTLFAIAAKNKVDLLLLIKINNLDPANPIIRAGDKLTIPGPDTKLPSPTALPKNLRSGQKIPYTVQAGDSLLAIALNFNSTVDAIKKENKITNENDIFPGQIMTIPVNLVTEVPTATKTGTPGTPAPTSAVKATSAVNPNTPPAAGSDVVPEGTLLP
jgi:LysM repeat protein